MSKGSFINYAPRGDSAASVHHYELHLNGCAEQLTVYACADESCNELYDGKAKLHVKANGSNLANFNNFYGSESQSLKKTPSYPFTMVVQSDGKGGNMDPDAAHPLVCYVNGEKTCTVTAASGGGDAGTFSFDVDTAYAGDGAPISFSGGCLDTEGEVEVKFGFDRNDSGDNKNITVYGADGKSIATLSAGEARTMTLPVSGARLSYPHADLLTLSVQQVLPQGGLGSQLTDKAAFVPLAWQVQRDANCGDSSGFVYSNHAGSCVVLGAAGEPLGFSVAALDANEQLLPLDWLADRMSTDLIHASLENGALKPSKDYALNDNGAEATFSTHQFASDIVGRLQVKVDDWQAAYIAGDDTRLVTQGDSAYVGRTVPASLKVTAISGDIEGDVIYAGVEEAPNFSTKPAFTVVGLDADGNTLASYSGEFAGGLEENVLINLNSSLDYNLLEWDFSEPSHGQHSITINTDSLVFLKNVPFREMSLDLPLELTISAHDCDKNNECIEIEEKQTTLADEADKLRYGFITLMDTEVKVGEAGTMASKLNYYGDDLNTLKEDGDTDYSLSDGDTPKGSLPDGASFPGLSVKSGNKKVIDVAPYSSEQKNIEVTIENLPAWLKLADQEKAGELTNPSAMLDILSNPRLRASDRTYNRREVIR
ncbi:hypothetical protein B6S08_03840 [Oceanimonas doudoroffii]|uniref:DUF6701 domain-containing protein n=2 Tax=Oceanimonas doudoroffii TaxID=84158 RepID=A0A233RH02_9GAMM|nr:hypothetical protein B6S08_03840 [Oceanimonas doudoroffii]